MGAIAGLVGLGGGVNGTGINGPANANIQNGTSIAQTGTAYGQNQSALNQQNALLSALQNQGGLTNQSQVYNQLQGVVNGTGPNPAQAMLNQATGQNVANQAALMAGQRGAGSNVGLIARQAAQQGAAAQQQAVDQGATMQANQSLNALGQAGSVANTQASNQIGQTNANTSAQQQEQANLLNALQGYNSNQVGMQSNTNSVNGQLANTNMQGQQGLIGGVMNGASTIASMFAGGGRVKGYDGGGEVSNEVSTTGAPADATPTFAADSGAATLSGSSGGGSGGKGAGGIASLAALLADGGPVPSAPAASSLGDMSAFAGPTSKFGQFLKSGNVGTTASTAPTLSFGGANPGAEALQKGLSNGIKQFAGTQPPSQFSGDTVGGIAANSPADITSDVGSTQALAAKGGKVPALVSPGEKYLKPQEVAKAKQGVNPMKLGETIPGKPRVGGAKNSYANDTVPKTLEEGGVVLPRSVTQSKNPGAAAKRFMDALQANKKAKA